MRNFKASTTKLGRDLNAFLFVQDWFEMIPHFELVHIFGKSGVEKKGQLPSDPRRISNEGLKFKALKIWGF